MKLPKDYKFFNADLMEFLRINLNLVLKNYKGVENYLEIDNKEVLLFIDGKLMNSTDITTVALDMESVENIMLKRSRLFGYIQVFTTKSYKKNSVDLFDKYIALDGYDRDKKYYSPVYEFDRNKFRNWIELDWKPKVKTNSNGEAIFRIANNTSLTNCIFSIQGMTENGFLISEILRN